MKVCLVVGDAAILRDADTLWRDALTGAGHEVTVRASSVTAAQILTLGVQAVVVSGTAPGNGLPSGLAAIPLPVVIGMGQTGNAGSTMLLGSGTGNSATNSWTTPTPGNSLLGGASYPIEPWVGAGLTKVITTPAAGVTAHAQVNGKATLNAYLSVSEGAALTSGTAPAGRVALSQDENATPSSAWLAARTAAVAWLADQTTVEPRAAVAPLVSTVVENAPAGPGQTFTLRGSASVRDGDPAVTAESWTAVTAGAPVIASDVDGVATVTVDDEDPGTYVYRYDAENSVGESSGVVSVLVLPVASTLYWVDDANVTHPAFLLVRDGGTFYDLASGEAVPDPLGGGGVDPEPDPFSIGLVVADVLDVDGVTWIPNPNNGDLWVKTRLEGLGYTCTYVADSITSTGFDGLLIAPSSNQGAASGAHNSFDGPLLNSLGASFVGFDMASGTITSTSLTGGHVVNASHPIAVAAGLSAGALTFLSAATAVRHGTLVRGTPIIDTTDVSGSHILSAFEVGELDDNSNPVPHRRVAFGLDAAVYNSSGSTRLDATGLAVFDAAAQWTFGPA